MKAYRGSIDTAPIVNNLDTSNFIPQKTAQGTWVDPRAGLDNLMYRKISFSCRKSNHDSSAVAVPTELSSAHVGKYGT
jgi:hypothetical protein